MKTLLVPYHHTEALPALTGALQADDAVVVSKGPPAAMLARIYDMVAARVARAPEPLCVVSGDCATSLATLAGLQRRGLDPGVLWLDAHADFHTPRTTRSGYFGGMALAMVTGRAGTTLTGSIGMRAIPDASCALIGARDVEPAESDALAASGVRRIALDELATAALPPSPWYVHLDVDVIDPSHLAPLRFPAPGGATVAQIADALETIVTRGTVAALGLACTFAASAFSAGNPLEPLMPLISALASPGDVT